MLKPIKINRLNKPNTYELLFFLSDQTDWLWCMAFVKTKLDFKT